MLFTLLFAFLLTFFLQDSTTVNPEPSSAPSWMGYLVGYVLSNLVPLATSYITKNFLNLRDTWYARLSDVMKGLVYTGVTALLMLGFQVLGVGWDATADAPTIISKIVLALASTLLVKVGINTARAKAGVKVTSESTAYRGGTLG